jgi:exosortase
VSTETIAWKRLTVSMAVIAALLASLAPAALALGRLWLDSGETTYTHGFLVATVSLFLLWRAHVAGDSKQASPASTAGVAAGMLAAILLWEMSYRGGIQLGMLLLLPPLLWAALFLVRGAATARASTFALAFLYFAMPVWGYLNGLAQATTIAAVRFLLRATGVPTFFSGDIVQIPAGTFRIEGGCSGLHFIIVALAIAALLGEVRGDRWRVRLRWLAIALALAVFTNWVRVYTIILIGHLTHMQHYVVRVSHYGYGWLLFALALAVLFLLARRAPMPEVHSKAAVVEPRAIFGPRWAVAAAALIATVPALLDAAIDKRSSGAAATSALARQAVPGGWYSASGASSWMPEQLDSDSLSRQRFRRGDAEVEVVVASYIGLAQGKELGGFANRPAGDAEILGTSRRSTGKRVINEQHIATPDGESLVWVEYRVDSRSFASAVAAQLWYSWQTVRHLRSPPSSVRLWRAACAPDCSTARTVLSGFLDESGDSA